MIFLYSFLHVLYQVIRLTKPFYYLQVEADETIFPNWIKFVTDADDLYVVQDVIIYIKESRQRGEVEKRESNEYIFIGPMQLNKTAFYQIIHIQCMRWNLILK